MVPAALWACWLETAFAKAGVGVLRRECRDQMQILLQLNQIFSTGGTPQVCNLKAEVYMSVLERELLERGSINIRLMD